MAPRRVLLLQLDGKFPNLALLRIAAHHRDRGDEVKLRHARNVQAMQRRLGEADPDAVYASLIFTRNRPLGEAVTRTYPQAVMGGTGWDERATLADAGIDPNGRLDYGDYPRWTSSLGFSQRGCRLKCPFCVVPRKEGAVRQTHAISEIWRGEPHPRHILLLDNDFFGQAEWPARIEELRAGGYRLSFSQGINARMLNDETAAALASVDYRDNRMRERRIYTAFDNRRDARRFFAGLQALIRHGVRPRHLFIYMLIGYWPNESSDDRLYRLKAIRDFGALPYPMPFRRTRELVGFQRWVIGGYDHQVPWKDWEAADYRPTNLRLRERTAPLPLDGSTRRTVRRTRRRDPREPLAGESLAPAGETPSRRLPHTGDDGVQE